MYLCILYVCLVPSETEEMVRAPGTGVKDFCEQPHVYLGPARAAAELSL